MDGSDHGDARAMASAVFSPRPLARVVLVAGGYAGAVAVAAAVVALGAVAAPPPDASGGMAALGDAVLFLGTLAVASLPATGAALYFLRAYPAFWRVLSPAAAIAAATALAALAAAASAAAAPAGGALGAAHLLAPLRILAAPALALLWLLAGLCAPRRGWRIVLVAAAAVEVAVFAAAVGALALSGRS